MINDKVYSVGLYIRLSREDENKTDVSESITNQKSLLLQYVKENNLINKNDVNNKIFNKQIENDKRLLVEGINKLRKILNCPTKRVVYNLVNNRTYACIKVNNIKVEKNKDYLLNELSNNYHLEFKEDKDNLTLIELHLKNNLIS